MNILIAIDFSKGTSTILAEAKKYAEHFSADYWLIHVAEPDPYFVGYEPGPQTVRDDVAKRFRKEHQLIQQEADKIREQGVNITPLLVQGPAAETILKEADNLNIDLIMIGSHGHGALYNLLLGSVSQAVLKNAKVPVLIVPTHERE
jgi:nucleotide-binding universal stress UspA family protein